MRSRRSDNRIRQKRSNLTRVSLLLVLCTAFLSLTGCFDLGGAFQDGQKEGFRDYYDAFGTVLALTRSGEVQSFDVSKSLFNTYTVNKYSWENKEDAIERDYFMYIAIPVERDLAIYQLSLFVNPEATCTLRFTFFIGEIPDVVRGYNDPYYGRIGADGTVETYTDPIETENTPVALVTSATGESWTDFSCSFGEPHNPETNLIVKSGDVLLIRVENNTGYGKDKGLPECKLSFLNLLIAAD